MAKWDIFSFKNFKANFEICKKIHFLAFDFNDHFENEPSTSSFIQYHKFYFHFEGKKFGRTVLLEHKEDS